MTEQFKLNDFLELEYTGRTQDNKIFDTNVPEEASKLGLDKVAGIKIICLGQSMILKAIDDFLLGKDLGKYTLTLEPEQAFGFRQPSLVKIMPMSVFQKQQVYPQPGMVFSFDNALGKVSSVSGGRVIVDFNNPLASKQIIYELEIKKLVSSQEEKIKALMIAFFQQEFPFRIQENKLVIETKNNFSKFVVLFKDKFKEILNLELEVEEKIEEVANKSEKPLETADKNGKSTIPPTA